MPVTMPTAADFAEARAQHSQLPQAQRDTWANVFGASLEGTIHLGCLRQGVSEDQPELRALLHYVASIASRATVIACERENAQHAREMVATPPAQTGSDWALWRGGVCVYRSL